MAKRYDFYHVLPDDTPIFGIVAPKGSKLHYVQFSSTGQKPQALSLSQALNLKHNISKIEFAQAQKWGDFMIDEIGMGDTNLSVIVQPIDLKSPIKTDWYECALNSKIHFTPPNWQPEKNWQAQNKHLSGCEMANQVRVFVGGKPFVFNEVHLFKLPPSYPAVPNQEDRIIWRAFLPKHENSLFKFKALFFDDAQNLTRFYGTIQNPARLKHDLHGECDYAANEYVDVSINQQNQSFWAWTRWDGRPKECADVTLDEMPVLAIFEQSVSGSLK
ncbi:hypothetical protein [Alysiella filiformis]|uniref:hypothetical protein n=1 Tax=Alysiella filiformis TaxID=194196 RepID=UPI0011784BE6|nr:hypothetical protein [Alysiella filiformis]QMT32307.1 hypothetical protein H3L97_05610 [Alysiella filiformis]UBQ56775.1 hypothetical protein JF568_03080 [Alysiella filiformis DSM 16848]